MWLSFAWLWQGQLYARREPARGVKPGDKIKASEILSLSSVNELTKELHNEKRRRPP
jgi:hypothetical protein